MKRKNQASSSPSTSSSDSNSETPIADTLNNLYQKDDDNAILTENESQIIHQLNTDLYKNNTQLNIPISYYLDFSGSMNTPFKIQALHKMLLSIENLDEKRQPFALTRISDQPTFSIRMSMHENTKDELKHLYDITPAGGTYLWESIGSCLLRYSKLGLANINVVVLTDGEDNKSNGEWNGIKGAIQLMKLARELGTSLTISFVQLGGSPRETANIRTVADITGGSYLHIDANLADPDQVAQALDNISKFGNIIQDELSICEQKRNNYIKKRRTEGFTRILQLKDTIDPILFNSPDYAAMYWSYLILSFEEETEKQICRAFIYVVANLIKNYLINLDHHNDDNWIKVHANKLRELVHKELPHDLQKTFTPKQVAHFYNTNLVISKIVQLWMTRGQGKDCGMWTITSNAKEVLDLSFQVLSQSDTIGQLYSINPFVSVDIGFTEPKRLCV